MASLRGGGGGCTEILPDRKFNSSRTNSLSNQCSWDIQHMAIQAQHRVSSHLAAGLILASLLAPLAAAQSSWPVCGNSGEYTPDSKYQSNLNQISATLPSNASRALFATAVVGAAPDIVYALALCRGDANASTCESCIAGAFLEAQQLCGFDDNVTIIYDDCNLRYSNQNFLAESDSSKANLTMVKDPQNVSSPVEAFDAAVGVLLNATANYAAMNSSLRFATGEEGFDSRYPTIYGLAQCTPDLPPADCRSCLGDIIALMPQYLSGRQGGRIMGVRCNFRYELSKFFTGGPTLRLQTPLAPALAPNGVMPMMTPGNSTKPEDLEGIGSLLLDLSTLRAATDNFAESNWVGEGGFGAVYKGVLTDGQQIAVKRFSQSSGQGIQELKNELLLVAKLQHKNLARLVGVCLQEHEKLLVYEYMPNRSIDTILFDPEKSKELDWGKRLNIINGIARGLNYLHEDSQLKIIHRDLKASNILLDSDYTPKISDFGLARLFGGDQSQVAASSVVGTYGYMAPEYAMRGHYSVKSDVFSFGILMLEIY
ncbi:hypothetical protein BS78_02G301800 [Paspalum vaginatum]|nr:hypothetical protein BS78_02G301800 [Paspalum vaginatum]